MKSKLPAFVIKSNPTVTWPIRVKVPVDGGTHAEFEFSGTFFVRPESEWAALVKEHNLMPEKDEKRTTADALETNARLYKSVLKNWSGIVDGEGEPVPFSAMHEVVTGEYGQAVSAGIMDAWLDIRFGRTTAKREPAILGNSAPSPDTGSGESTTQGTTN